MSRLEALRHLLLARPGSRRSRTCRLLAQSMSDSSITPELSNRRSARRRFLPSCPADRRAGGDVYLLGRNHESVSRARDICPDAVAAVCETIPKDGLLFTVRDRWITALSGCSRVKEAFDRALAAWIPIASRSPSVACLRPAANRRGRGTCLRRAPRFYLSISFRRIQRHRFRPSAAYLRIGTRNRCTRAARALTCSPIHNGGRECLITAMAAAAASIFPTS